MNPYIYIYAYAVYCDYLIPSPCRTSLEHDLRKHDSTVVQGSIGLWGYRKITTERCRSEAMLVVDRQMTLNGCVWVSIPFLEEINIL
jgi:hypothetical protein